MLRTICLLSGALLATLHAAGIYLFLYWYHGWFDLVTHTIGGFFLMTVLGVLAEMKFFSIDTVRKPAFALGALVCVMITWEFFEFYFGMSDATDPGFVSDTIIDFITGSIGGVLGYLVLRGNLESQEATWQQ